MAALENPRHEHFVSLVSTGVSPRKAYVTVGYRTKSDDASRAAASRLLTNDSIATRLAELKRAVQAGIDIELQSIVNRVAPLLIRDKMARILSYEEDYARIVDLQRARAEDVENKQVPGASTGLLAVSREMVGKNEYKLARFDAALMREKRELLKQMAIEREQWVERSRVDEKRLEDLSEEELRTRIARLEAEEARKAGSVQ